jgi:hypothetical protein
MNVVITLLFLVLLGVAVTALLPVIGFLLAIAVVGGCMLLWLLPILIIAGSDKTSGGEKAAWICAIVFLSWFAWIFYFFLAPLKPRRGYYYY